MKNNSKSILKAFVFSFLFTLSANASDGLKSLRPTNELHMNICSHENSSNELEEENFDISQIVLAELEEDIDLGFDPYFYLPHNFDPYKGMLLDVGEIIFLDIEEEIHLTFNPKEYLPDGFNPYACVN